jgi:AcrR family transcriptional regulator
MSAVDTRARLIQAALDHLDEHGLQGLSLRGIARSSGVSHGAPMRHFDGMAALLASVAAFAFDQLHATVDAAVGNAGPDPLARLRNAGRAYVAFAVAQPGAFELMFRPELIDREDAAYLASSVAAFGQLSTLTLEAQETGWFSAVPAPQLTGVLWASVHGIAALWVQGSLPLATGVGTFDTFLDVFQLDLAHLSNDRT